MLPDKGSLMKSVETVQKMTELDGIDTLTDVTLTNSVQQVERTTPAQARGRENMQAWVRLREGNCYSRNHNFRHTLRFFLQDDFARIDSELAEFGALVPTVLDAAATENDYRLNNPRIEPYDFIGNRVDRVVHHPDYTTAGDIIYGTGVVKKLRTLGGLREGHGFYFLANHVGEAGHLCPVICSYETSRVLHLVDEFPERDHYIARLEAPSYSENWTSSQFLTEVQGGSDVGANDTRAWQDTEGNWFIRGEKWFCSNANAELMVISARRSMKRKGTRGLSMFLIPHHKPDGSRNDYTLRRLKEKLGTRALASAEIDFHDAYAIPLGDNFNFMLEKVVHHSRIALCVAVLGFTTRAFQLAWDFSRTREAFGRNILQYPLVRENLARVHADVTASLSGAFQLIALQDRLDLAEAPDADEVAFCRLMVNIGKSVLSRRAVDNIHHCLDGIGGNGAIENTSSLSRLLRDAIILENWEGTHNTLYMQVLRDFQRYQHDQVYLRVMRQRIAQLSGEPHARACQSLETVKAQVKDLHAASDDLKSLKIQDVVIQMAHLHYYVALVMEALDQQQTQGCTNKWCCAELYYREFLALETQPRDDCYLALCSRVLDIDGSE
jgi:alkylation response protein AidB-like acyl-CoA dehydrogenase